MLEEADQKLAEMEKLNNVYYEQAQALETQKAELAESHKKKETQL